ncbi:MAG: PAS domain-containing sensor histidine kinase [Candidatus Obscuribacterales bacterium]|nr:PAS domain-containing sensor histidine kinase [Candidatus Obscuribacterales bacterium]
MKSDFPILISILTTLLIVCGFIVANSGGANTNIVLLLLGLCGLIANFQIRSYFALRKGIDQLTNNAQRLREGQTLQLEKAPPILEELDHSMRQIKIDFNELSRREQSVISQALDVICTIGPDQNFESVNPASKKILGYEPAELVGKQFTEIILPEDRENSLNASLGAARSVDVLNFENRVVRKNGSVINMLWSAHWSAAEKKLFCVAHDITARKDAERLLAESEARIRQIIEILPVGLLISNELGIVESANQTLLNLSSMSSADFVGKHLHTLMPELLNSPAPPEYSKLIGTLTDSRIKLRTGEFINVQVSASKLILGSYSCYLIAIVDTSEKEKLEQVKREFFAMVNHDLRAPLTSLLSVFDVLSEGGLGPLTEYGNEVIQRNAGEVGRLIKLVDELLDIEKMKAGKFEIEAELSDVDYICLASMAAVQHLALRHKISIQYTPTSHFVYADKSLLIRVLVNLLSNAVKFSPPHSEVIVAVSEKSDHTHFEVKDNGPGVPEEYRELIFEQYKQVPGSDEKKRGTGLGLPICKMIVEQHGGRIWLASEARKGSSFQFTIPNKQD